MISHKVIDRFNSWKMSYQAKYSTEPDMGQILIIGTGAFQILGNQATFSHRSSKSCPKAMERSKIIR
jgi:hypothetical protein